MKDLESRLEAEALAGPVVELADAAGELLGRDLCQVGALGQVLTQQAMCGFVGATLPAVVRVGEVDRQLEFLFQFERAGELTTVVQGQTLAFLVRRPADRLRQLLGHRLGGTGLGLAGDRIAAGPIDTGQHNAPVAFAEDGIALPIAEPLALVGRSGPLLNGAFAGNLAPAERFAVGLASELEIRIGVRPQSLIRLTQSLFGLLTRVFGPDNAGALPV